MEVVRFKNLVNGHNGEIDGRALEHRRPFRFRSVLTEDSFESLLAWLSPVREEAAIQYEEIRSALIKIFTYRGCPIAEELADETINRVAARAGQIAHNYTGEPNRYFYGVAKNVHLEYHNRPRIKPAPPVETEDAEDYFKCLDSCLSKLTPDNRRLALEYYGNEDLSRKETRRVLAESMGITLNALRIRLYEIRTTLRQCVEKCVDCEGNK